MAKTDDYFANGGYLVFGDEQNVVEIWQPKRPNMLRRFLWRLLGVGWRDSGFAAMLRVTTNKTPEFVQLAVSDSEPVSSSYCEYELVAEPTD